MCVLLTKMARKCKIDAWSENDYTCIIRYTKCVRCLLDGEDSVNFSFGRKKVFRFFDHKMTSDKLIV